MILLEVDVGERVPSCQKVPVVQGQVAVRGPRPEVGRAPQQAGLGLELEGEVGVGVDSKRQRRIERVREVQDQDLDFQRQAGL